MDLAIVLSLICLIIMEAKQNSWFGADYRALKTAKKELNLKKPTMIKYDMRDLYIMRTTIIVLGALIVLGAVAAAALYNSSLMDEVYQAIGKEGFWILVGSFYACFVTIFVMTIGFFYEGWCYVNSLASHRFYVPDNKKDYCYALEGLPRAEKEEDESIVIPEKGRNKESLKLSLLSLITSMLLAVSAAIYHLKWGYFVKRGWLWSGFFALCWSIGSLVYYKQSDEDKYSDRLDIDIPGKKRRSWGEGVSLYVFYIAFTVIVLIMVWMFTSVFYKDMVEFMEYSHQYNQ